MKLFMSAAILLSPLILASLASSAPEMPTVKVIRSGSQSSAKGPAEYFTGSVRVDPLFSSEAPSRTSAAYVTFEPGARTAWHTHPAGQRLIVTAGAGLVQHWGGPIQPIKPGDVVIIPPGVKHWHGASAITGMTHIAIQEQVNGKAVEWMEKAVEWMEKVTDDQYKEN